MRHFTRRSFLASSCAVGTAALSCSKGGKTKPDNRTRPNILFLFTDDQRFDTIRALGNTEIKTPAMDELVSRGMVFSNAYIMGAFSAAVCMPSRAMLMTGRHLFHVPGNGSSIPADFAVMPETLRQNGYHTWQAGKWHNGREAFARSFDDSGHIMFGGMSDHYDIPTYDFDPSGQYENNRGYHAQGRHSSTLYANDAISFLGSYHGDDPFFMFVSFQAPHDPRNMPDEYRAMYDPDLIPLPDNFMTEHPFDNGELDVRDENLAAHPRVPSEIRQNIADYYAMITHLDAEIGRVIQALRDSGRFDNTVIILAGDNGLAVGQHGLLGKQNLYDHSLHVPFIMAGPGITPGMKSDTLCYLYDIFPTICDMLDIGIPGTVDGISLAPVLGGGSIEGRESLYFAYKNFQRALRTDRWKLILYNVDGARHTQLFDLQNDPRETENLADSGEHRQIVKDMTVRLKRWFADIGDPVDLDKPGWGVEKIPSWQELMEQRKK